MNARDHVLRAEELVQQCEDELAKRGHTRVPHVLAPYIASTAALASAHVDVALAMSQLRRRRGI